MQMTLKVPQPVAAYLEAEESKDAEQLALCFAEDAVVHDEGRDHRGRNAIQRWKEEADTKYQYVLEPLDASVAGDMVRVRARLTGNFPGSPIELDHIFKLDNDKIASLEIRS
jgi:ketosteroid isomerase-like protein